MDIKTKSLLFIRRLKRGTDKMDEETKKKFMDTIKRHFEEYFNETKEKS